MLPLLLVTGVFHREVPVYAGSPKDLQGGGELKKKIRDVTHYTTTLSCSVAPFDGVKSCSAVDLSTPVSGAVWQRGQLTPIVASPSPAFFTHSSSRLFFAFPSSHDLLLLHNGKKERSELL